MSGTATITPYRCGAFGSPMAPTASIASGRSWPTTKTWADGPSGAVVLLFSRRLCQSAMVFVKPASSAVLESPDQTSPAALLASGLS